ncbi:hypothetical protein [Pelagibius sp. Alg239-R121]|uniref:hypothetical protein n=1 Tax=Pelagibius sp. Alg239-R121 TaxID=2993448 RepID=UPI0024A6610D|nr:hypothetical protein [Pelagibius sp. Alg239-R121]
MGLEQFAVFGFEQEKVLGQHYNEAVAKKGVCSGLVVRFAQLCYGGQKVTETAMENSIFYSKLVQDRKSSEFQSDVEKNGAAKEMDALTKVSPYTGFITRCDYADAGMEGVLSSIRNKLGIVHFVGIHFDNDQAHSIGVTMDNNKNWCAFDPNQAYFEGKEKDFESFFTFLATVYEQHYCKIFSWQCISLIKTPGHGRLTQFLSSQGL